MRGRVVLGGWGWLLHITLLLHRICICQGSVYMTVSPYPARIYKDAPPGVPVLTVQAYDNATGEALTDFRLEDKGLSDYFAINSSGILSTARHIDRIMGFQFKFFVFAVSMTAGNVQTEWKHVIIDVGEKNLYPPDFTRPTYNFSVYRYAAPGTLIGTVSATDPDTDPHNRHFTIYAPPRQSATNYVTVMSSGNVILAKTPPEAMTLLKMVILAVDDGSPQRTGTTMALIVIDNVNQPSKFCLSTTERDTTLCWKNPMPGRRHQGYNVVVEGQGLVLHKHINGDADAEEFCVSTSDLKLGQNYTFRVTLDDDDSATPPGVELSFSKLGQGFSLDCTEQKFNACNFLSPCQHGARCEAGQGKGTDYTCDCSAGWHGKNCTQEDLCHANPCQNKGTCLFTGHRQYKCQCSGDYLGQNCQNRNLCAASAPCQNGGDCRMHDNGTYSCACPNYFTGVNCTVPDPCSPSPCGAGGTCVKVSDSRADCVCHSGYRGDRCQAVDACRTQPFPCANGGTCIPGAGGAFTCTCPPQFTGSTCEIFNACTLVCKNNATCQMMADGNYNCSCPPSYHGLECQHYNRCHGQPCGKNGTCSTDEGLPLCACDPGFFGAFCEKYNPCRADPCEGHGDCLLQPPGRMEDGDLPYECECYRGWWGLQCQFPDLCHQGVCQNGAQCSNTPPNNYKCDCVGGTYGDRCQHKDPCYSSPCRHAGHCRNVTDTLYNCTCLPGYSGDTCQHVTSCTRLPCANGGSCQQVGDGTVRCACAEGFLGYYCQLKDPCFEGHGGEYRACEHGRCESVNRTMVPDLQDELENVEFLHRCLCDEGYTGVKCDVAVQPCDDVVCFNNGDCLHGVCVCPPGFTGSQCEATVTKCGEKFCGEGLRCVTSGTTHTCVCQNGGRLPDCKPVCRSEDMVSDKTGRYVWPETAAGFSAELTCPYGPRPNHTDTATRPCHYISPQQMGEWGEVDDSNCNELGLLAASRLLTALKELTSHPASLGTSEVHNYTTILEVLYVYTLQDQEVASLLMNVISNLADVNVSVTVASDLENNTSARLLNLLDRYTADVNLTSGGNVSIMTPNFEVMAVSVQNTSLPVTYRPCVDTGNFSTEELGVSIMVPPQAFVTERLKDVTWNRNSNPSTRKATRVQLIGHRKSQLFIPRGGGYSEDTTQHQPVISASVAGRKVANLSIPVVYKINNRQTTSNYTCVFWNPTNHSWSSEGVATVIKNGNFTLCHSLHMTSFAVLLDPSPHYMLSATHEAVLTYISYIGSAVSLFCLVLTIITYALFRSLNKDKSGKILLHLCVALLLLNAVFLASGLASSDDSSDDLDDDVKSCTAVGALLHYLLLASLTWMLVEAVEMYRALVTVFAKYAQCYMLKRCVVGWGLPLVIVGITLAVDTDNYDTDGAFCFISRTSPAAYYGSLVAPACVVLVINTVIFILVTRVILRPRFQQQQKQKGAEGITPAQVRGAFTVMFLLGVTWVFGPLAIREAKVVFNYLFCILNSLQGFLIFVFRCLFNPEVRMCWVQLVKTGTLKKRRGPIRSNLYSDTSSKADGKSGTFHNGSHGAGSNGSSTTKTSLRNSNGWHPKLNGFSGNQIMERRGTKFSTLDFAQGTPESVKKAQKSPLTEEERYGDGNLDHADDPNLFPEMDYYETGHDGHEKNAGSVSYEDFHGDGGVLDYYESIRSSRKEDTGEAADTEEGTPIDTEGSGDSGSKEKRPSEIKTDSDELTYL